MTRNTLAQKSCSARYAVLDGGVAVTFVLGGGPEIILDDGIVFMLVLDGDLVYHRHSVRECIKPARGGFQPVTVKNKRLGSVSSLCRQGSLHTGQHEDSYWYRRQKAFGEGHSGRAHEGNLAGHACIFVC